MASKDFTFHDACALCWNLGSNCNKSDDCFSVNPTRDTNIKKFDCIVETQRQNTVRLVRGYCLRPTLLKWQYLLAIEKLVDFKSRELYSAQDLGESKQANAMTVTAVVSNCSLHAFDEIKRRLLSGEFSALTGWSMLARVQNSKQNLCVGETIATVIKFFNVPIWTINPCRVTSITHDVGKECQKFSLTYSTLRGHLLLGDEMIELKCRPASVISRGDLTFQMTSRSTGNIATTRVLKPLVEKLKRKFLQSHANVFCNLCNS